MLRNAGCWRGRLEPVFSTCRPPSTQTISFSHAQKNTPGATGTGPWRAARGTPLALHTRCFTHTHTTRTRFACLHTVARAYYLPAHTPTFYLCLPCITAPPRHLSVYRRSLACSLAHHTISTAIRHWRETTTLLGNYWRLCLRHLATAQALPCNVKQTLQEHLRDIH